MIRRRALFRSALLIAGLGAPGCSPASTAPADQAQSGPAQAAPPGANGVEAASGPVRTGVTTHFSQGWPPRLMASAAALGTATIRDSLHWAQIERQPGQYAFTEQNSGHVARACQAGMTVLLGIEPRNRIYDGGATAYTPATRAAFANYIGTIADRWPKCVVAIEIGNEINGQNGITGPAAKDRITAHVALLKSVRDTVKPRHPHLLLIGGSTNTIGTGFLTRLFRAGMLAQVDAVAVHPYRPDPEGVEWEIARVQSAMAQAGAVKPIWATEFSREFPDPAAASAFYLKMIALLEGAGVNDHFWYALVDQSFYPTMGLLKLDGTRKPAAAAYDFAAQTLAPLGPARRIDQHDPALFHFRFGADTHVVWGGRRTLAVSGNGARFFAADGRTAARPAVVSDTPVVITGAADIRFGVGEVLADSLYGFARAPLGWFAQTQSGSLVPLSPVDWAWTTYLGNPALPQVAVNRAGIGTTAMAGTLVRYTATADGPVVASVCLRPGSAGARASAALRRNGAPLWSAPAGDPVGKAGGRTLGSAAVTVRSGDTIDFVLSPLPGQPGSRFRYRFRVARSAADAAGC